MNIKVLTRFRIGSHDLYIEKILALANPSKFKFISYLGISIVFKKTIVKQLQTVKCRGHESAGT